MIRTLQTIRIVVLLGFFVFGCFFVGDTSVFAQTVGGFGGEVTDFGVEDVDDSIALSNTNIIVIITRIIRIVLGLLGIIVLGLIIYAGFTWMTSQGQEDKIRTAKQTLINATIGLAIIMSAFAIVSFIINALTDATQGTPGGGPGGGAPEFLTFAGSGALGDAVLDHYPFRFQEDVPRNTKIAITFREPIDPTTIMENTNNTCFAPGGIVDCSTLPEEDQQPVYGDCVTPDEGVPFDWAMHCDALVTSSIQIYQKDIEGSPEVAGAVLATYDDAAGTEIRTIAIRPYEYLGSAIEKFWYRVQLTRDITNLGGEDVFRSNSSPYHWDFRTDTILDLTPPVVESISPSVGGSIAKNTIIQINFNEAMDPVTVQGLINTDDNPFTNVIFHRDDIEGRWQISNAYRTIEFIPSTPCEVTNSCGEVMYCLPVAGCDGGDVDCTESYSSLVRTGQRISDETWEGVPFSGAYDMSGNILDGDDDGEKDPFPGRPNPRTTLHEVERAPDNFFWDFSVRNEIDRRLPYPYQISPGVDAQQITGNIPVTFFFSMQMLASSLYNLDIEEYPGDVYEEPWTRPLSWLEALPEADFAPGSIATKVNLQHREFGPNDEDFYYFINIPGGIRGSNQNCLYPGVGPMGIEDVENDTCVYDEDTQNGVNCVDVTSQENNDTGCAHTAITVGSVDQSLESREACLDALRAASPLE